MKGTYRDSKFDKLLVISDTCYAVRFWDRILESVKFYEVEITCTLCSELYLYFPYAVVLFLQHSEFKKIQLKEQ